MGSWSVTELSSVILSDRIDGEYYLPSYLANQESLTRLETCSLPHFFFVSDRNHLSVSRHFSDRGEVPYYRGQDINDFFLENASPVRIPERIFASPMMRRSHFQAGDVLLSIVGTIGSLSVVPDSIGPATGSCKIAILRSKGEYSPLVLAAFLLGKYGQLQIQRNTRGAVQMGLILKDLSRIRVPTFSEDNQKEIASLLNQSIAANTESRCHYSEAQQLLESKLGLGKLTLQKPVGYTARFSEVEQSRRLDAEYFYPAFKNFVDRVPSGVKFAPLSHNLSYCQRGKQPSYSDKGLPVINSKHVQPNRVILEGNRKALASLAPELQIRYGDVLMNGTGRGTLGRVAPYLSEGQAVPDNHITILRSSNLDPVFVSLYLNSAAGQMQVEMHQRGTSGQLELYPFDIRKFLIWDAPESFQREVRKSYDKAAEAERQSKELLDQAKSRVEQLIQEAVKS